MNAKLSTPATLGAALDRDGGSIQTGPFGSQLHASDYCAGGPVPVIPTSAIGPRRILPDNVPRISRATADVLSRHNVEPGDILFARRGVQATGLSALAGPTHKGWICGTGVIRVRTTGSVIDPEYLSFVLSAEQTREWIRQQAIGATMPNLNEGIIRRIPLTLPPLDTQRAIARVLGSFDDKIELNRQMNETLEAMARALFKSWFVDFDPVRAKQEDRAPYGMDAETAALFPDAFEGSELGSIPKGWRVAALGSVTSYLRRGISPKYTDVGGVTVINQKCIRDGRLSLAKARRHDSTAKRIDGRELRAGDVVVNSTGVGTLGRVAQVPPDFGELICDSHVTVVRADSRNTNTAWLGIALLRSEAEIEAMGEGSTGQTELSRERLGSLALVVPPMTLQSRFENIVGPLRARVVSNERESETLAELRDTLLPKLISGELRLPEAGDLAEAALAEAAQ